MARLVERTDRADKIRQRKDSRFYAWRFGSPLSRYRPSLLAQRLNAAWLDDKWSLAGRDVSDLKTWELRMVCSDQY